MPLITQHVVDADMCRCSAEKLRMLRQSRGHEQGAVAASFDGQHLRAGILSVEQMTRAGGEVIKGVMLVRQPAGIRPVRPDCAVPAEWCICIDAPLFERDPAARLVLGLLVLAIAAVAA